MKLLSLALLLLPALSSALSLSGSPAVIGAGTYPRTSKLNDGTLIGCLTATESGTRVLRTFHSTTSGSPWSTLGEITRGTGEIDNCALQQLSNGRILAAFRNHDANLFRITSCYSDDGGKTWSYLTQIATDPVSSGSGNWEPFFRIAKDGRVQVYYSRENNAGDQDNLMRWSNDGGATWTSATVVSGGTTNGRDGMVGVTELGGKLIAVFETTEGQADGKFAVKSVVSSDDGNTWPAETRKLVYKPSAAGANAGAPQVATAGNTLVASFMTDEDSVGKYTWPRGAAVKVVSATSVDGPWGSKLTVGETESFWAGIMGLDAGSVLVALDHAGGKTQKVVI